MSVDFKIRQIHTPEEMVKTSKHTKWCTANRSTACQYLQTRNMYQFTKVGRRRPSYMMAIHKEDLNYIRIHHSTNKIVTVREFLGEYPCIEKWLTARIGGALVQIIKEAKHVFPDGHYITHGSICLAENGEYARTGVHYYSVRIDEVDRLGNRSPIVEEYRRSMEQQLRVLLDNAAEPRSYTTSDYYRRR